VSLGRYARRTATLVAVGLLCVACGQGDRAADGMVGGAMGDGAGERQCETQHEVTACFVGTRGPYSFEMEGLQPGTPVSANVGTCSGERSSVGPGDRVMQAGADGRFPSEGTPTGGVVVPPGHEPVLVQVTGTGADGREVVFCFSLE
jgi:hypothetical protein